MCLMDFHSSAELNHRDRVLAIKEGVERKRLFKYLGNKMFGYDTDEITEEYAESWKKLRYLFDECLEDGYLKQEERYEIIPGNAHLGIADRQKLKGEYIFLTSKGKKLARKKYYYLKYLPEEFGDAKKIIYTIVGTIITMPIWKPLFSSLGISLKDIVLGLIYR